MNHNINVNRGNLMSKRKYPKAFKKDVLKGIFTADDIKVETLCHGWDNALPQQERYTKCYEFDTCMECKLYKFVGGTLDIKDRSEKIKNKMNKWLTKQQEQK